MEISLRVDKQIIRLPKIYGLSSSLTIYLEKLN
nr:MAG TPA: hypothetical protein [Caudoviricetes sp.]